MGRTSIGIDRTYNTNGDYRNDAWNDSDRNIGEQFYVPDADGNNVKPKARLLRPAYGYTVEYDTKFRMFSYGDGYYSVSPVGLNPTTVSISLNYEGLDEATDLKDFVGFIEATRGENFTFLPPEPFCKYNDFSCEGYNTTYGNNSHQASVTLVGTSQSSLNINKTDPVLAGGAFPMSQGIKPPEESSTLYLGEASQFTGNYKKAELEPLDYEDYKLTGYNDRITRTSQGSKGLIATTSDSYEPFEMRLRGWKKDTFYPKHSVVSRIYDAENPTVGGFEKYLYAKEDHVSVGGANGLPSLSHVDQYWSSEFNWQPTAGSVSAGQSRVMKSEFGEGRTETISDGRNANPLVFNFQFNNRSDIEAYSILHYLESRRGYIRFPLNPEILPPPYSFKLVDPMDPAKALDQERYFLCGKWSYTKHFLGNNSINATFIEDPLGVDLAAESYDRKYTEQP